VVQPTQTVAPPVPGEREPDLTNVSFSPAEELRATAQEAPATPDEALREVLERVRDKKRLDLEPVRKAIAQETPLEVAPNVFVYGVTPFPSEVFAIQAFLQANPHIASIFADSPVPITIIFVSGDTLKLIDSRAINTVNNDPNGSTPLALVAFGRHDAPSMIIENELRELAATLYLGGPTNSTAQSETVSYVVSFLYGLHEQEVALDNIYRAFQEAHQAYKKVYGSYLRMKGDALPSYEEARVKAALMNETLRAIGLFPSDRSGDRLYMGVQVFQDGTMRFGLLKKPIPEEFPTLSTLTADRAELEPTVAPEPPPSVR